MSEYILASTLQISSSKIPYYEASYCLAFIFYKCFVGAVLHIALRFLIFSKNSLSTIYLMVWTGFCLKMLFYKLMFYLFEIL